MVLLGAAACLAALLLAAVEVGLRMRGYGPTVVDDRDLWALQHHALARNRHAIAVLGNSQAQVGLSPAVLARRFPGADVRMLALEGSSPVPVLFDLANDPAFVGSVICTIGAFDVLPLQFEEQASMVRYSRREFSWDDAWNRRIATWLQARAALKDPYANPRRLIQERLATGRLPGPRPVLTKADRSREVDHRMVPLASRTRSQLDGFRALAARAAGVSREEWHAYARALAGAARAIESRGGAVVFIRLPLSGESWAIEERAWPKSETWDAWVHAAGITASHFVDESRWASFHLPDLVHIDRVDIQAFSDTIAAVVASAHPHFARGYRAPGERADE